MSEATSELVAGARAAFSDAVHALIGLRPDSIERDDFGTEAIVRDSLYTELLEAKHGERQADGASRRPTPGSRPPGWTDALSLVVRIDQETARWWPHTPTEPAGQPITVRRLYALVDWQWAPHEIDDLRKRTRQVDDWVKRARTLLPTEIQHTWELRAPCPACGETTQLIDNDGEHVRRYVLQADASSAKCVACETSWAPENYRLLAQMIGAEIPDGVLE
ncbi:DUF7341 domain-containing protein [Nocardia wallacei]|uniref:DUF7341 domain-containing protein n=1 Tax=Nocardia wallacei TaxID=480035 RepID=UPI0024562D97|nr:hypothetical protein [Nocardia wallacei]